MVDLDRDGRLDLVSGSYPGELYVFAGGDDGGFGEATRIQDAAGEDVNVGSAAALHVADWDGDGDLDLVVGDIRGHVWFLANESGGDALEIGAGIKLTVGETTIRVPHGDAGPVVADWDGNGTLDLVVGCGDGSVRLYANRASEGTPELEEPVDLWTSKGGMSLKPGESVRSGARAKPCVVDWNGDGQLDLLVGDVLLEARVPKEPSAEDEATVGVLRRKQTWILDRYGPVMERVSERVLRELGTWEEGSSMGEVWERLDEEQRVRYRELHEGVVKQDVEARALQRMLEEVSKALAPYRSRPPIHGHVWLFLRHEA